MTSSTDFNGNITLYTYDTATGKLSAITDAASNVTSYNYYNNGSLWKITYPDNSTEVFVYDNRGNVISYKGS